MMHMRRTYFPLTPYMLCKCLVRSIARRMPIVDLVVYDLDI